LPLTNEDWCKVTRIIGQEQVRAWERERQIPSPKQLCEEIEKILNQNLQTGPYRAIVVHRRRDGRINPEVQPSVRSFTEEVRVPRRWLQYGQEPAPTQGRSQSAEGGREAVVEYAASCLQAYLPNDQLGEALAAFLRRTLPSALQEGWISPHQQAVEEWVKHLTQVVRQPQPMVSWVRWGKDDFRKRLAHDLLAQATLWGLVFLLQEREGRRLQLALPKKDQEWIRRVWEEKGGAIGPLLCKEEA
jgi:hypothetical protein